MIRDLELLLLKILDEGSREFMQEAVRCYNSGAYRSAIVMAVTSGMDDLRRKLEALANSQAGAVTPAIKAADIQIRAFFANQQAFEAQLIDVCETHASMLSHAEAEKLRLLLKTRHLCAHPSGHVASAEEARDVVSSMIDLVLSRPALMGLSAVTELIERLKGPLFFPSHDSSKAIETGKKELAVLLDASLPALASKVFEAIREEAAAVNSATPIHPAQLSTVRVNLWLFALAMVNAGEASRAALWQGFGRLVEDSRASEDSLYLLASDPAGIAKAKPLTRERAVALIRRNLRTKNARLALKGLLVYGPLSAEERAELLEACRHELLSKWTSTSADFIREVGWDELDAVMRETLVVNAGEWAWATANGAIDTVQGLPTEEAYKFSVSQQARYILNAASRAHDDYGPKSARPLLAYGLRERCHFVDGFVAFIQQEPQAAREFQTDWNAVGKILISSGRQADLACVFSLFKGQAKVPKILQELAVEVATGGGPSAVEAQALVDEVANQVLP